MTDESLRNLHSLLMNMAPGTGIMIGSGFLCSVGELDFVITEAMAFRELSLRATSYEPYNPPRPVQ